LIRGGDWGRSSRAKADRGGGTEALRRGEVYTQDRYE
jgi:hypothetical protein